MSLLVVGSVALDSIETPFGSVTDTLGGSATFFSAAASLYCGVQLVGVVGSDFPMGDLAFLERRGVDLTGLAQEAGESFRWSGVYSFDLNSRETLDTRLGVFADFKPHIPESFKDAVKLRVAEQYVTQFGQLARSTYRDGVDLSAGPPHREDLHGVGRRRVLRRTNVSRPDRSTGPAVRQSAIQREPPGPKARAASRNHSP